MPALLGTLLAVVFLGASVAKLTAYDSFLRSLTSLPWLPLRAARVLARAVPLFELCAAALLLAVPRLGAAVSVVALATFSCVLIFELHAGRSFDCGCFGGAGHDARPRAALLRNGLLLVVAAVDVVLPPGHPAAGAVLAGVGFGFLFLLGELSAEILRGEIA